jgi:lipopolysaccharide biosynthesis protein
MESPVRPRCLSFFLPQYHPIPENDDWWGRGFTEWRNVTKATPRFRGHYQPHLPADLGFYDLRIPEVRDLQARLALEAGLSGFVYYHYWFNGKQLLERPLQEILLSGSPSAPFCMAWANENWTRRWDGDEYAHEALVVQEYSPEDDRNHIEALRHYLIDDRYLKEAGRPVLLVYRANLLPNPRATTEIWRAAAERWGLPGLYLLRVESFRDETGDPVEIGFDAAVQFQPSWENIPRMPLEFRLRAKLQRFTTRYSHRVLRYGEVAALAMELPDPLYVRWPCVTPGFDNSPRRAKAATILLDSRPEIYGAWLKQALSRSEQIASNCEVATGGYVFINAWNEWAEGNHLEPDLKHGRAFLEATRQAIDDFGRAGHIQALPG